MVSFSQVIIIFPDQQQKSDIVQLRGPKNEVEKCAKFLQKLIAELVQELFPLASFLLSDNICFVTNTRSKKEQLLLLRQLWNDQTRPADDSFLQFYCSLVTFSVLN